MISRLISGTPRIQAGRKEVLVEEAQRLAERAKAAGVETELELYDERLHIFALFPFLPNATRALEAIRAFVARRLGLPKAAE
jgi:acetyl esterase/lipase